ncbi:putative mucin/carbohydrate-binding domain-containing protein [Bacillus thuringiensis]|uniref:putative mucin/carbohydrate-binding domain-containing protein n=1 Tax=Bacillus thuringiensis TaxID=1428 RepID=UPI0021D6498D|nr:putative mucin/carbohydrate-binding domain-containing protein [Bacillus thuringiensis]MCU7666329.1 M60 family metallopeptidase [Bacillus thuringiensis]
MSKQKKSRVLVAGICISTLLSPVAFEASKGYAAPLEENKGGQLEESKENRLEQRTFHLPGKGSIEEEQKRLKVRYVLSANEPTGIYASPNEEIKIEIKGTQSIKAFIGTKSYDEKGFEEFELKPGENNISSSRGGILYFYNMNNDGEVAASVIHGGSHFPLFILGKHTKKDWDAMLKKYKNPYAVELKGERSLITASPEAVENYMGETDPVELMRLHDKIIRFENSVAGLSEDGVGLSKAPNHYIQFVEKRKPDKDDWMFATHYHTGYVPETMDRVLNIKRLQGDGWGPWHEVGHLHQQAPWFWSGVGEVTVNIYSLSVQRMLGNKSSLEEDGHYKKAFAYLDNPDAQKKMKEFEKLVMFWQLDLAYGEHFYPNLHQMYRLLPEFEIPASDEDKKQMFIYMASKAAEQNLVPFFEKWGLSPNDEVREKIENLNLPKLEKEIWKATDSNIIREKQVKPYGGLPYGEASNVVQNLIVGANFNENLANSLVRNLGENVKVTGRIMWPDLEVGKRAVLVEIEDEKGQRNFISVPVNSLYGDTMVFKGYGDEVNSVITLLHDEKKINVSFVGNEFHERFKNEKYVGITLYDKDGNEKKNISIEGQENSKKVALQLEGVELQYGDIMKVYHAEPSRFDWYQSNKLVEQGGAKNKKEKFFKITPQGYELIDGIQEVEAVPQKVVIGADAEKLEAKNFVQVKGGEVIGFVEKPNTMKIGEQKVKVETKDRFGNKKVTEVPLEVTYGDSLVFKGLKYNTDIKSIVTLQHNEKKFSATADLNQVHHYFKEETYFEFTLLNQNGIEKKKATVKGIEKAKEFANAINGLEFEYGDVVKVYHAESDRFNWYQNNDFIGQGKAKVEKELLFKVTEKGFERMEAQQEVTAVPQKVIIGTDAEKLEAKDFVQVKDGEVLGFVEKPDTTKIGEQKVKVETKDRFGNKKVTEVPLTVTYGDSLLVYGLSYGTDDMKSIITLHHDTKKMSATDASNLIHDYFGDEKYFEFTMYNKEGKEKKNIEVKGLENTKAFAKEVNGLAFEYGDVLKVYHAESSRLHWYQKGVYGGEGKNKEIKELLFKITENGFERLESEQTVTVIPQKVTIGTDVAKLDAKNFVQVKDGEVVGFVEKPNTTKIGEQKVKVETKDRFGHKKVTEVPLEVIYGDSIMFFGTWDGESNIKSVVTLKHEEKKFSTTDSESPMHTSFADEKYMGMTVYDKDGKEKKALSVKASENTKGFAEQFNGMAFEYGDMVKVYQKEFDRFKVYNKNELVNTEYGVHEVIFKVTEHGFERMEAQQEVTAVPQKVVIGTDAEKLDVKNFVQVKDGEVVGFVEKPDTTKIGEQKVKVETKDRFGNKKVAEVPLEVIYGDSLVFQGDGNNTRSIVTVDHNVKKLQATFTDAKVHYRFENEKYMGITLYDQNGNEKKVASAEGQESSKNFAEQLNGVDFAYGDVIKVYHAESDRLRWYQKNEFVSNGKGKRELYFKLTEKGFERVEAQQEVTAVPQKVVIGTDAEKLEAKNFVQVKDGEVLGFVEKPDTTKIGEQKVKVETKDRFGNKKVTEVSVEVTYGDSIVYQGVSNVTRSIITLNYAEKKLHATFTNDEVHYRFVNEQYIGLTIYDQNGNEKKHVTAEGQETSKNFAEQVNGTAFEYGDVLKVYHAEPSRLNWYKKNELVKKEDAMKGQEISFKITQNGLEQVQ